MVVLAASEIRKQFGPEPLLTSISFEIRAGEKIGLVGPNGTGKTTLMKILASQDEPDAGQVTTAGDVRIGYLDQQPQFPAGRTTWDEALSALDPIREMARELEQISAQMAKVSDEAIQKKLGERFERLQYNLQMCGGYRLDDKVEQILTGLRFSPSSYQQPVEQLSGGQQNRLLLAKLLLAEPDVMLLDEPSNHLDLEATQWLEKFLATTPCAVLVVSHDRYLLDQVTHRTLELFRGTVDSYTGNFSHYVRQKAERVEVQRRTYEKQQAEVAKMEDFVRRYHYGQRHAQAEDRRKKLERIELVEPPREIVSPRMRFPPASRTGDIVVRVERLAKAYDRPLFSHLSLDVLRGERWGIVGPNGCGKTTLLRCILGQVAPDEGRVNLGAGVKVAFFDQQLATLTDEKQVVEAIRPDHKEFIEQQRRDLLARFGITGDLVFQKVGSLSGGERNRVALARLAALDANVLVLDEPTNHLDLWARGALEEAVQEFDGTVLFVSHDRYFVNRVADHLLVPGPGGFRVIEGNYETYAHLMRQSSLAESSAASPDSQGNHRPKSSAPEKTPRRRRKFPYRKAEDLEQEIHQQEHRLAEIHRELALPNILRDGDKVRQLKSELDLIQQNLPTLYEHWEEALELN